MIKRLLKSVRAYKKDALLTPFFVVLEVVMEVVIPAVMALLIDRGIDAHNMVLMAEVIDLIGRSGHVKVA